MLQPLGANLPGHLGVRGFLSTTLFATTKALTNMDYSASAVLDALLAMSPCRTAETPRHSRGVYGLYDHCGALRYIGSTSSTTQSLYERIHQRHRTGSEDLSHYFAHMYNTGRMWRDRRDALSANDAIHAKALRNAFVAEHCGAVWVEVPDHIDIAALERSVLGMAPAHATAWNNRAMAIYNEPSDLVDLTLARLEWDSNRLAALHRQRQRHAESSSGVRPAVAPVSMLKNIPPFPKGPFRFFALDVETANGDRSSICQIGVACVRADDGIETWMSYVDPHTENFSFSMIHGITASTVRGAPSFTEVLPTLKAAIGEGLVYQHSSFDRSAINAVCSREGMLPPSWNWRDSVGVARKAWPELRGNGGHGLASLKRHLDLRFQHHDAGEDARAAAEVVLRAEAAPSRAGFNDEATAKAAAKAKAEAEGSPGPTRLSAKSPSDHQTMRHIGTSEITQGNIDNSHIYLRAFFDSFPPEVVGGSNAASAAPQHIVVEWGGTAPVNTDLDGTKKFFRKRGWIRQFFELYRVVAGSEILVEETGKYRYRLSVSQI